MPDIAPIENPQSTQPLDDAAIARLQNDLPDDEILYDLAELFRVFGGFHPHQNFVCFIRE